MSTPTTTAVETSCPKPNPGTLLSPPSGVSTRRSSNAGLPATTASSNTASATKKTRVSSNNAGTANNNAVAQNNSSNGNTDSTKKMAAQDGSASAAPENNAKMSHPNGSMPSDTQPTQESLVGSGSNSMMRSPGMKSPSKKRVFDRFIPVREGGLSEQFDLLPETSSANTRGRQGPMAPNPASQIGDHYKNGSYNVMIQLLFAPLLVTVLRFFYVTNLFVSCL
ncbi:hypothetical protein BGZ65_001490 [Modicella reniformis]|uniref:Uncharacterized protein n=1 Tax=Modicella reniformis TaxID=1440133 RepID=A0A9P6M310_9FUNG|nr:hypothetical protein BGZ65_001490 [Modicella reniformis]